MYHVPLVLQYIYGCSDKEGKNMEEGNEISGVRERVEIAWPLFMQMTWFCVVSRRKTRGQWWDILLRCVGEVV